MTDRPGFSTRAIRAASRAPRLAQRPTVVPIYQSATFAAEDMDELTAVLADPGSGYSYSRIGNPTTAALGAAVAELEGAEAGIALATGMAAVHAALVSIVRAGDRVVAGRAAYGSTRVLLVDVLARLGVQPVFVDATDTAAVDAALRAAPTRVLYAETIANPTTAVVDHAALAELAHRHGATYVVDNTFASPYVCRPLELGADLVIESATKYLGGHNDVMAGTVAGSARLVDAVHAVEIDTGGSLAPLAAFLVLRGIQTLAVRVEHQARSAARLAGWLERQPGVSRVHYPGLPSHPQAAVAARQLHTGGGMLAFELEAGREAGPAFIDALTVPELTASLGGVHTMVVHPPTTSHRQLDEGQLAEAGIGPGLLRVSVGLEDVEDLERDFERALTSVRNRFASDTARATSGSAATAGVE